MAKLSARGATVLWMMSRAHINGSTMFHIALRSDGTLLRRTAVTSHVDYGFGGPRQRYHDSGHWTIIRRAVNTSEERTKLIEHLKAQGYEFTKLADQKA